MPMVAYYDVEIRVVAKVAVAADSEAERTSQAVHKAMGLVSTRSDPAGQPYPSVGDVRIASVTARRT